MKTIWNTTYSSLIALLITSLLFISCSEKGATVFESGKKAVSEKLISIQEGTYEGRPHFIIQTPIATYWLDKKSGGLSRAIDRDKKDWIAFKKEPWDQYPPSAASAYRGLPNLVFQGEDGGFGHPGHDLGKSMQEDKDTIVSISNSKKWKLRWDFYPQFVRLTVEKADPSRKYWFLYEGPIAGTWNPNGEYFATDVTTPETEPHDYFKKDRRYENWQWAYFGDETTSRVMYIVHEQKDELDDLFAHLGNTKNGLDSPDGMVVFGFGRGKGTKPLLSGVQSFRIGFIPQSGKTLTEYEVLKKAIETE